MDNGSETTLGPERLALGKGVDVWVAGPEDGDPLLLLHGWGLRPFVFDPALAHLAGRGYRVAVPTLAVVGRRWDISRAVHRAHKTVEHLGWSEAVVVGYSLGGAIATALAATHPGRVRLLALVDSIGMPLDRNALGWTRPILRYAKPQNLKAAFAFGRNALHLRGLSNMAAAATFARTASMQSELDRIAEHATPAGVLWGTEDGLLPLEMGRAIAARLGCPIHLISGADHDWPVLDPPLFATELDRLIRSRLADRVSRGLRRRAGRSGRP